MARVIGAFMAVSVTLLGFGGYFIVENAAKLRAASVSASEVANSLRNQASFIDQVTSASGAMPPGAIVAIDDANGCPSGWTPYTLAYGRMIVGATLDGEPTSGLTRRQFGERGGEEVVALTLSQLPSFNPIETVDGPQAVLSSLQSNRAPRAQTLTSEAGIDAREDGFRFASGAAIPSDAPDIMSTTFRFLDVPNVGGGQPHNNMSPYIALYFCRKD